MRMNQTIGSGYRTGCDRRDQMHWLEETIQVEMASEAKWRAEREGASRP